MPSSFLAPEAQMLLHLRQEAGLADLTTLSPEQARVQHLQTPAWQTGTPAPVGSVEHRTLPGPQGELPVRLYAPEGEAGRGWPILVFFHGGGWVVGNLDSVDGFCRALCHEGRWLVVSVDYRLAPECRFPGPLEDCWAATQWVARHARDLGGDPRQLAVGGDSAGGNLAAAVALRARDQHGPELAAQVLIYPVTDLTRGFPSYEQFAENFGLTRAAMGWFIDHYLPPELDRRHPEASVLFAEQVKDLPPTLMLLAGCDVLRDEGLAYAKRLREAQVPVIERNWEGMLHGFVNSRGVLPQAREASNWIARELNVLLQRNASTEPAPEPVAAPRGARTTGALEIREMELDDLHKVYALGEQLYTAEDWPNLYRTWDETDIINMFNTDGEFCWVADAGNGEVVGFALGSLMEKRRSAWVYGWLDWLGVSPQWQGKGVGKRLLDKITERFIAEGARMLLIDTEADNKPALRFFVNEGFGNPNEHVYLSRNLTRDPEYLKLKERRVAPRKPRKSASGSPPRPQRP